jgi:hypothetical protein
LPEDMSEAGAAGAASAHDTPDASDSDSRDVDPGGPYEVIPDSAATDPGPAPFPDASVSDAGSGVSTSGVNPNLLMPDLSPEELTRFCEWSTLTIMEGGAACVALATESDFRAGCLSGATLLCDTVAALERCMRDMATNDCIPEILPSCQEISECGSTSTPTEPVPLVCTPGTGRSCVCPDGSEGTQVCLNDGSGFAPCACIEPPPPLDVPYGYACPDYCPDADCYVPGTGGPGICSRRCESDPDCGPNALCQASGGTGMWCFRTCESDADCAEVAAYSNDALYCALSYDPYDEYYGWGDGPGRGFCVQTSEP